VSGKIIEEQERRHFGPTDWLARRGQITIGALVAIRRSLPDGPWRPMWPVPADAMWLENEPWVLRLQPRKPDTSALGREAPHDARPGYAEAREALRVACVESKAKPLGRPRWWDDATLAKWLSREGVEAKPRDRYPHMASRLQVHVGIRPDTLTGDDGILFAHDAIETLERRARRKGEGRADEIAEWAIGAEVTWPVEALPKVARLGSDSRIAWIEEVRDADLLDMPKTLRRAFATPSPSYYGQLEGVEAGKRWPNDYDRPNPVGFISVKPGARLLVAVDGDPSWAGLAIELLIEAIGAWGAGGKTAAGYGRGR
jgi:hypothetical protein